MGIDISKQVYEAAVLEKYRYDEDGNIIEVIPDTTSKGDLYRDVETLEELEERLKSRQMPDNLDCIYNNTPDTLTKRKFPLGLFQIENEETIELGLGYSKNWGLKLSKSQNIYSNILHMLVSFGNQHQEVMNLIRIALNTKKDFDVRDCTLKTPLLKALSNNTLKIARLILQKSEIKNMNLTDIVRKVSLSHLISKNNSNLIMIIDIDEALVNLLIDKGLDLTAVDALGNTPLHYAAFYRNEFLVKKLCKLVMMMSL